VVSALHERGFETAILTGGFDVLAAEVAEALGIEHRVANEFVTDERGFLTGEARMHVDPLRKEIALERLCHERHIALERCLTVGDSEMDASFLRASGRGVLVGPAQTAQALGVPWVAELRELLDVVASRR